jgi:uncharacterized protein
MEIKRFYDNLEQYLHPGKVLVLYGPRRVGKTTLLQSMLRKTSLRHKLDSGDNIRTQEALSSRDFSLIKEYIAGYDLIAIDEAQQIPEIGMALKIIVDQYPDVRVVATGSSSFDLANTIGEPLTGRKRTLILYPIAQYELLNHFNSYELRERLEEFLIFGSYPDVITASSRKEKIIILNELVESYLLKDILAMQKIKNPRMLLDLLKLLALQVGQEVSLNELGRQLGITTKTVQHYIDLLEKTFIIKSVHGFSRNLRSEITKKQKYYFLDNGIRNGVIGLFGPLDSRNDVGFLWENFIFSERIKKRSYLDMYGGMYFWRTYAQDEIDIIEEHEGALFAYECKWSDTTSRGAPRAWKQAYPDSTFSTITPKNYMEFIGQKTQT